MAHIAIWKTRARRVWRHNRKGAGKGKDWLPFRIVVWRNTQNSLFNNALIESSTQRWWKSSMRFSPMTLQREAASVLCVVKKGTDGVRALIAFRFACKWLYHGVVGCPTNGRRRSQPQPLLCPSDYLKWDEEHAFFFVLRWVRNPEKVSWDRNVWFWL